MSVVRRFIDLRSGEGPLVAKTFGALFGLIAGHTILETARDALFLGSLPASRLTLVYLALALIGLVVPAYNSRFVRAYGRRNAVIFTLMLAAVGTTLWHFQPMRPAVLYGLYLWSGLLGTVLVVQFWMFTGQLFTVAQGKRLLPGIAAGGVLGAVVGGVLTAAFLDLYRRFSSGGSGVSALLLLSAGCFLLTAGLLTSIVSDDGPSLPPARRRPLLGALSVLREHPYVARVALIVALSTSALLATDYLFKFFVKATHDPSELAGFFARYYAALNALALVVQLVVAQRLLQRVGVLAALALLPVLLLMGSAGIVIVGGSAALILATKGADGALRHSLHRVTTELLYMPLPAEVRDRAKSLLDAVFVRGSQALTAGGILLLVSMGFESTRALALLVGVLALSWLAASLSLRSRYLEVFRQALGKAGVDPALLRLEDLDIDSVESVMAALSSPDPVRVVAAMNLLVEAGRARPIPALIFYHDSEEVLLRALDILPPLDDQLWRIHAARLTKHASVPIRARALRALGRACEAELVRPGLHDDSPTVRAHAAFQLAQCEGADEPLSHPAITELLESATELDPSQRLELRLGLLQALRDDADDRWVDVLLMLAQSDVPPVVESVALAMARMPDDRFVPLLVEHLSVREARSAVRDALLQHGAIALAALERALDDPQTRDGVRRYLPLVIAAFRNQVAADMLLGRLDGERDGAVRYRMLRGLTRIVAANPLVELDTSVIERAMEHNLVEHLRLLSLWWPLEHAEKPVLARASAMLLVGLLEDKLEQAAERAFRLFKLLHPREDVQGIFTALRSLDRRVRANAQEFLDALALESSDTSRQLFAIIADDLEPAQRIARAVPLIGSVVADAREAVAVLLSDEDESVAALAAYHAFSWGEPSLVELANESLSGRPALRYVADAAHQLSEASHG